MAQETTTRTKMMIRRDDTVEVISGNDRGTRGRVLRAYPKTQRIVVEHVNIRKKAQQARQAGRGQTQAGIVQFEATIHVSNAMLVCPKCDKRTRISVRRENGVRHRVCKQCGEDMD